MKRTRTGSSQMASDTGSRHDVDVQPIFDRENPRRTHGGTNDRLALDPRRHAARQPDATAADLDADVLRCALHVSHQRGLDGVSNDVRSNFTMGDFERRLHGSLLDLIKMQGLDRLVPRAIGAQTS
jgi:hypothetical protein